MPTYKAPLRDMRFVLFDVLGAEKLATLPGYEEAGRDMFDAIMEEGAKITEEVLQPLNRSGDEEGCHWADGGVVTTPKGFKEAYKLFREGGWTALSCDTDFGGSGLPHALDITFGEMMCSANLSFG